MSQDRNSLAELVGVVGKNIRWDRVMVFWAAFSISQLMLMVKMLVFNLDFPRHAALQTYFFINVLVIRPILFSAATLVALRLFRDKLFFSLAGGLFFSISIWLISDILLSMIHLFAYNLLDEFIWGFFILFLIALALERTSPLFKAVCIGGLAAFMIFRFLNSISFVLLVSQSSLSITLSDNLKRYLFDIFRVLIFAYLWQLGLDKGWFAFLKRRKNET